FKDLCRLRVQRVVKMSTRAIFTGHWVVSGSFVSTCFDRATRQIAPNYARLIGVIVRSSSIVIPTGLKLTLRIEPVSPLCRTKREQDQILVVISGRVAVQARL